MPRLWIAAIAIAVALLGLAPAAAQANVTSSTITSWVTSTTDSNGTTTLTNAPYVVSFDNAGTTLTVSGTATGTGTVAIVCFYGGGQWIAYSPTLAVTNNAFHSAPLSLRSIGGHTCRLRAIPSTSTPISASDTDTFAGPRIAVAETGLAAVSTNSQVPYNYLVSAPTFTGAAGWGAAGSCGPFAAAMTSNFDPPNNAINCAGSLLSDDLGAFGGRSEVQVDGVNAYDAASAQSLFSGGGHPSSQTLSGFPSLSVPMVDWDPTTGLMSSSADEGWVVCDGPNEEKQSFGTCPRFLGAGVALQRNVTSSDGGRVVTMTDTWSSTDQKAHTLDLLYDDYVGMKTSNAQRGYEFPGQSTFTAYGQGDTVPAPGGAPGSILVRTNLAAADGDPTEAVGAITFSAAPSGFAFASNNELEEHQVLQVPAGGAASLTYVYSTGFSIADVTGTALAAQDHYDSPALAITSPANGATVTVPTVALSGTATAGSGFKSITVGGQTVSVSRSGAWSANVALGAGSNTITAIGTDAAGATLQAQVTVVYQPPSPTPPPPSTPSAITCTVPRTKGMKLPAAERALRRAHCKVGKVKRVSSKKIARGRVMNTTPRPGRRLPGGAKVALSVSKGA